MPARIARQHRDMRPFVHLIFVCMATRLWTAPGWTARGCFVLCAIAILGSLALGCDSAPAPPEPKECTPVASNSGPVGEWEYLGLGETNMSDITSVAIDPCDSEIIYAGSSFDFSAGIQGNLFKSEDGGQTWDTLLVGEPGDIFQEIQFAPSNPNILYAAPHGIIKSTDGGATWQRMNNSPVDAARRVVSLAIHPENPDILYAGTVGFFSGRLYKSTDGGQEWKQLAPSMSELENVSSVVIHPADPTVLYAGANGAVFKSTDSGGTWHQVLESVGRGVNDLLIDARDPQVVYAGLDEERHIMRSTDAGQAWTSFDEGLPDSTMVRKLAEQDDTLYLIAHWTDDGAVYRRSTESDSEWTRIGVPRTNYRYYYGDLGLSSTGNNLYVSFKGVYRLNLR